MSDFDFDELDKAVQSFGDSEPTASVDANPTVEPNQNDPKTIPINVPSRTPITPSASPRTGGRFMDVVHPSSDMRPASNIAQPKPVDPNPVTVQSTTPAISVDPVQTVTARQPVVAVQPETTINNTVEPDDDADIEKLSEEINKTLGLSANQTLETPFVPDVKVEKRPLGAFSDDKSDSVEADISPVVDMDAINNQPTDTPLDTPLPAELQNDLLSIESSTVAKGAITDNESVKIDGTKETEDTSTETLTVPQHYSAATQSQGEDIKANPPMYDNASTYNKPILHPAKNKSWMWIVWMVLLIVVGAGIGVAAYFFLLPNL